jgi:hypothetical protein
VPYPTVLAGQRVTSAMLNAGKMEFVTNSGGAQTNTSTTPVDATGLGFPVEASSRYLVHVVVSYDSTAADDDIRFDWTMPSGGNVDRNCIYLAVGATTNIDSNIGMVRRGTATDVVAGGTAGVDSAFSVYEEICNMTVSTTAGTAQFRFGLGTAPGTATLQADSVIYYQRIA